MKLTFSTCTGCKIDSAGICNHTLVVLTQQLQILQQIIHHVNFHETTTIQCKTDDSTWATDEPTTCMCSISVENFSYCLRGKTKHLQI